MEKKALLKANKTDPTPEAKTGPAVEARAEPAKTEPATGAAKGE